MKVSPPLLLGFGAAGVYAWVYTRGGAGRSPVTLVQETVAMVTGTLQLTPDQQRMRLLIERRFSEAGLGFLGFAAVANAYAESKLDPAAVNPSPTEDSVGLFQLNLVGAGEGMSTAERMNPEANIRRIITEARSRGAEEQRGHTHRTLVRWFAREVERCAACGHQDGSSQLDAREELLQQLYGLGTLDQTPGAANA